jgi:hypothetical protein
VVGEGEGRVAQSGRLFGERLREGGAVEQGEGGMAMEFGVSGGRHQIPNIHRK